jgi:Reverse transcriptase (RNA-dependent DNA polymerase)
MHIPKGFEVPGCDRKSHVLMLINKLYGQKQAGRVWDLHLHERLIKLGCCQSKADDCVYFKDDVIFCVYVDDGLFVSPNPESIQRELKSIREIFSVTVEGTLSDYVGVNIERTQDNSIRLTQPQLLNSILKELNFTDDTKIACTPAYSTTILKSGEGKEAQSNRRIIGKLNFLEKSCRPEIACAVHQASSSQVLC